jgi:hypothetical protein
LGISHAPAQGAARRPGSNGGSTFPHQGPEAWPSDHNQWIRFGEMAFR